MKLGWVRDFTLEQRPGGAQVCEQLLRQATPPSVELIECPPGSLRTQVVDGYVVLRCQLYSLEEVEQIVSKPYVHWAMDYWSAGNFEQRALIFDRARKVLFGSPLHKEVFVRRWGIANRADLLAYPMDVDHWLSLRQRANGRTGAMWYGEAHPFKGPDLAIEWARRNQVQLDVYGIGMPSSVSSDEYIHIKGQVTDEQRDLALASHESFIHFPRSPEGFCYSLMEAWLAGLEVIYSGRIGLDSWEKPWEELAEDCRKAPETFWQIVEQCLS